MSKQKIAFLVSGGGGNLRFIQTCIQKGFLPQAEIIAVVADRQCSAITYAQEKNIPTQIVPYDRKDLGSRSALQQALVSAGVPDIIVCSFDRILDQETVAKFSNKMLNLHYSLLPAFKGFIGENTVRQALLNGCKFIGTTVHFVAEEVDAGKIIAQTSIPVTGQENIKDLMNVIFRAGCLNLLNALLLQTLPGPTAPSSVYENNIVFSPALQIAQNGFDEKFWRSIA